MRRVGGMSLGRSMALLAGMAVSMLASAIPVVGQGAPKASVLVGVGNPFGWVGGQVAGYAGGGRVSAFVGLGVMPNLLNSDGDAVAGAVGARVFAGGGPHRGFLEISLSALENNVTSTFGSDVVEKNVGYGPGVAVGYQLISEGGFTLMLSGGVGYLEDGLNVEQSRMRPSVGLGIGYSVR